MVRMAVVSSDKVALLRKILEAERRNGFSDQAVIGGLDGFLRRWAGSLREGIREPALLRKFSELGVATAHYATLTTEQRREWVEGMAEWLNGAGGPAVRAVPASAPVRSPVAEKGRPQAPASGLGLDSSIVSVNGISSASAARFSRLGVKTIRDLLYFFPRRHLDYSQRKTIAELAPGEDQTLVATVWEARTVRLGKGWGAEATLGDETGNMRAVWFNQPFMVKRMPVNGQVILSGRVDVFKGAKVFQSPEWELMEGGDLVHTGRLVPVYPLTEGLWSRQVRKLVKEVVDRWAARVRDFLPEEIRKRRNLLPLPQAIGQAHYPDSRERKDEARQRLAFDELLLLQLGVVARKREWQGNLGLAFQVECAEVARFLSCLPFELTFAQRRVWQEITGDLGKSSPMTRLLEGDVGSGKTVVATAGMLLAVANGCQGALMAPTEILAEQHFTTLCRLLSCCGTASGEGQWERTFTGVLARPVTIGLLTGSIGQKEKAEAQRRIAAGEVDIVLGTHALIQKGVGFKKLGLVVVDEQHRFGVEQRSALRQKGFNPHMLVMTATPIPRTLALTLYGDMDLSVIDQLPPGRQKIKTRWLAPEQRGQAYDFIRQQVDSGRQAFLVCPLIEESAAIEAKAAVAEYQRLSQEVFPSLRLGLLHGRMSPAEKDAVMRSFREGEFHVLVSTPVVEVGIDVPNATVMLVEGADRFGLSQLHQFRGRVGRGQHESYCLLLAGEVSPEGRERLTAIAQIHDGFALAEEDLRLRGPGEFFGTRQSGLPELRMARLSDVSLLEMARSEALGLFSCDPHLSSVEHQPLARELGRVWGNKQGEWS